MKGDRAPVTSCYLDVDGRRTIRYADLEHEVDLLVRQAKTRANGQPSVQIDLRKIEQFVRKGINRSHTRGLAIFACSEDNMWEVIELPVPVNSQIAIRPAPAVGQLEAVVQRDEPIGVLVVDRQRAGMFVFALGEMLDYSEIFDALPRHEDVRGEKDRGGEHSQYFESLVTHHVRRAAEAAFDVWQRRGFTHLALAAREPVASEVQSVLHPYLADRLVGQLDVPVNASQEQLRSAVLELEASIDRKRQAALVDRLREAVAAERRGVGGLRATLQALSEHRVAQLLVSHGYAETGWRCDHCQLLCTVGRRCKRCGGEMVELEDVVEEAVQNALAQSCEVEICDNADLDVMGRIGALLRY
jgi:peptide chain release factor subunit 1